MRGSLTGSEFLEGHLSKPSSNEVGYGCDYPVTALSTDAALVFMRLFAEWQRLGSYVDFCFWEW